MEKVFFHTHISHILLLLSVFFSSVFRIRKILNLRLFADENGRVWSKSVMDMDYEVLCVSQFTLQCILKGNKPDFHSAMSAELAQPFYNNILENMRSIYKPEHIKGGLIFHVCLTCILHRRFLTGRGHRFPTGNIVAQSFLIGSRLLDIRPGRNLNHSPNCCPQLHG